MGELIAVFTSHAILDRLALAKITLRIVMESGPYRKWFYYFFFLPLHFASHYQPVEVPTSHLNQSSFVDDDGEKDEERRLTGRERRIIGIQLLACLGIMMFRYTILVLNQNSLHAVRQRIRWDRGNLVRVA